MEAAEVQRLREEQNRAIQTTNDDIDKWKKLKTEYKNLSDRLLTLPNKITHEVMVPFGPMAFMPGQLVHTNEILVLLGENWFVERSAKQASQIANRRKKSIGTQLDDLQLQKNLLVNRTSFTDEIHDLSEGAGDITDINEKYDEEKERRWKVQHKENIKNYHEELQREKQENPETDPKKEDEQSLWERLDELEKLEEERKELEEDDTTVESKPYQEDIPPPSSADQSPSQGKKSVRWVDEVSEEESEDTDSSGSESDEGEEEEDTLDGQGKGDRGNLKVINFTHSPVDPCLTHSPEETPKYSGGHLQINSPTDIYKYLVKKSQPKSILKSPSFETKMSTDYIPTLPTKMSQEYIPTLPVKKEQPKSSFQREKAFNESVVEKVPLMPANENMLPALESQQPKRISKFKASRLQRS